jgi:hypothetical protein
MQFKARKQHLSPIQSGQPDTLRKIAGKYGNFLIEFILVKHFALKEILP